MLESRISQSQEANKTIRAQHDKKLTELQAQFEADASFYQARIRQEHERMEVSGTELSGIWQRKVAAAIQERDELARHVDAIAAEHAREKRAWERERRALEREAMCAQMSKCVVGENVEQEQIVKESEDISSLNGQSNMDISSLNGNIVEDISSLSGQFGTDIYSLF